MHGPEVDGLDVEVLTRMEMNHRKFIWNNVQKTRHTPGYESVYLVETAPQLGVRITRVLRRLKTISLDDLKNGTQYSRRGGRGGRIERRARPVADSLRRTGAGEDRQRLAAGRCISAEIRMADLVRLIPNCFVTGHAAGVAAAVAVRDKCLPRHVDVSQVQTILRDQEAYLG